MQLNQQKKNDDTLDNFIIFFRDFFFNIVNNCFQMQLGLEFLEIFNFQLFSTLDHINANFLLIL